LGEEERPAPGQLAGAETLSVLPRKIGDARWNDGRHVSQPRPPVEFGARRAEDRAVGGQAP